MSDPRTDEALVLLVQAGDPRAFDVLVLRYQHRLVKLVGRYVRDQADALDITQDAFIKAYRALDGFRGDSAFYTWLYRIAVNTAKNHISAQSRKVLELAADVDDPETLAVESQLRDHATPERLMMRDQVQATVVAAMEQLPDDLRTAILLREVEGMSYEEIAEVMECPIGTVRSRIFRAREAITTRLEAVLE